MQQEPCPEGFVWGAATAAHRIEGAVAEDAYCAETPSGLGESRRSQLVRTLAARFPTHRPRARMRRTGRSAGTWSERRMIWFVLAQLLGFLVDLVALGRCSDSEKDLEIVLLRRRPPPRLGRWEKLTLAVLATKLADAAAIRRAATPRC